jgi:hypothetical protein
MSDMFSRRTIITSAVVFIAIVVVLWLAIPHIWLRDRSAQMVYDGKVSPDVLLYHGSGGREAIVIHSNSMAEEIYIFDPQAKTRPGIGICDKAYFRKLKFLLLSYNPQLACVWSDGKWDEGQHIIAKTTSIQFIGYNKVSIKVSWQDYSQPPQLIR